MLRWAIAIVVLSASLSAAQTTPPAKGAKKKDNAPEGYRKDNLRGFTLYFSDEVIAKDRASTLDRKPLEALERELIVVESVLPADKVKSLKAVPIWVEWDEKLGMGNGRSGSAVAVFYGGHQSNLLGGDKNPLKANAVTILSLKSLTSEHQPKTDTGRCVTLHELAHAFHHHVLGENALVKQTYRQAMERKLYDSEVYAATNDREYFAELTCAYLDRMDYFPRTRDELKKHDPKGYEMMEKTWGKAPEKKEAIAAKGPKLPSADGDGKFTLKLTTERMKFGSPVVGEPPARSEWKGRPIQLILFPIRDGRSQAALQKISASHAELKDYGLITVGAETSEAQTEELRKLARMRDLSFPLVADAQAPAPEPYRYPHTFVYDHAGQCIFRGAPLDAEPYVRIAVGKAILARLDKEQLDKATRPVTDLLEAGSPMPAVYTKLSEQLKRSMGEAADELKQLQTVLTEGGKKIIDAAAAKVKEDPVAAYFEIERLPAAYRGTPLEKEANSLILKLRGAVKVENELRARPALEGVRKLDVQLSGRDLSFNPKSPEFRENNGQLLKQLGDAVEKMKKGYPNMRATDEAVKIAERWAVVVK